MNNRRKLAAGNWKMNGLSSNIDGLNELADAHMDPVCDILICPPTTLLERFSQRVAGSAITLGGQDCHFSANGAHTGDVSADMLADAGATYVIVGHSERRAAYRETDEIVRSKAVAANAAGLTAVICVGETLEQRENCETLNVIGAQLGGSVPDQAEGRVTVVAYEPVWAIGTGKIPTLEQIAEVHDFMRAQLQDRFGPDASEIRLLYGGSVKPTNAGDIFSVSNVDGALVGGASLIPTDFSGIVSALEAAP